MIKVYILVLENDINNDNHPLLGTYDTRDHGKALKQARAEFPQYKDFLFLSKKS